MQQGACQEHGSSAAWVHGCAQGAKTPLHAARLFGTTAFGDSACAINANLRSDATKCESHGAGRRVVVRFPSDGDPMQLRPAQVRPLLPLPPLHALRQHVPEGTLRAQGSLPRALHDVC